MHSTPKHNGGRRLLAALCLLAVCVVPVVAYADELDDVRAEISAKTDELSMLVADIADEKEAASKLDAKMDKVLGQLKEKQVAYAQLQNDAADLATLMYKDNEDFNIFVLIDESDSLEEFLWRWEMREQVLASSSAMLDALHQAQDELNESYEKISKASDEKHALVKDLKAKRKNLDKLIEELKEREAHLDAEQKAALAQAAAKNHKVAETFETDFGEGDASGTTDGADGADDSGAEDYDPTAGPAPADENGWRTGIASAYGGKSDSSTPNPGTTATGTRCDDWSVGVAVPLSWGPQQYYGRYVEISYGGRSIIAPIVDCGDMDGGRRALDLQPGVFKAFGANKCSDWGLHEVKYRFV